MHHVNFRALSGIVFLFLLAASACKRTDNPLRHIPGDSHFVASIHLDQLGQKMRFNETKGQLGLGMLGGILQMQGIPNFIDDRTVTGIDFRQAMYVFSQLDDEDGMYVAVMLRLDSKKRMQEFLEKVDKGMTFRDEDGFTYGISNNLLVGWKGKVAYVIPGKEASEAGPGRLKRFFALDKKESMAANDRVKEALSSGHDMAVWYHSDRLTEFLSEKIKAPTTRALGSEVAMAVNFSKGKAVADFTMWGNEEQMGAWQMMAGKGIPDELLLGLPDGPYPAVLALNMDMASLPEVMEMTGLKELAQNDTTGSHHEAMAFIRMGSEAFTGQALMAFLGVDSTQVTQKTPTGYADIIAEMDMDDMPDDWEDNFIPEDRTRKRFLGYIAFGIRDREKLNVLLDSMMAKDVLLPREGHYVMATADSPRLYLTERAGYLTTDPVIWFGFERPEGPPAGKLDQEVRKLADEQMAFGRVEMALIADIMKQNREGEDEGLSSKVLEYMEAIHRLELHSYAPENGSIRSQAIMLMHDQDTNSLEVMMTGLVQTLLPLFGMSR